MIAEKLASQADKSATCPHCGCPESTKHECSLTAGTGKLLAQSKLAVSQWMKLTQCLAGRLTLRRCAKRCGVCLYSAWFMCQRACEAIALRLKLLRAVGKHFAKSLADNHGAGSFEMVFPQAAQCPQHLCAGAL
ncbi:hypothetical protein [Atopobium sp. oral taxon 416]|uniref:hypothetical protein n=1 Tax=Atopobium sp. oral taxon 416 TaxID=712157 RepID=UPI001BA53872|nr:hypothetical protein [Atopobium sp. oral taxon 416]QUC04621.1 hypothetical protein J4859_06805 [Atopobium sp. oral taxon 416]